MMRIKRDVSAISEERTGDYATYFYAK
jgi:hypothetical protein